MTELAAILAARAPERTAGRPCVLASVVGTAGSTYRRPGARMLVGAGGTRLAGAISPGDDDDPATQVRVNTFAEPTVASRVDGRSRPAPSGRRVA